MATVPPQASQTWHHALKLRKHLLKQLENLQTKGANAAHVAQFEAVEGVLEKFRLACVQTIFLDFEFAATQNTEEALWTVHTTINSEYRRSTSRLKQSSHAVERRKVEKLYTNFLRVSQKFYKGYIQRLSACYDIPELKRVASGMDMEPLAAPDAVRPVPSGLQSRVLRSCHSTLIHLGDLARYRTQAKQKNSSYDAALVCYNLAHHLMPSSGFAFHQMGIVSLDQTNHLDVVYHFYRAWVIKSPHPNAKQNLEMEFKTVLSPDSAKAKANQNTVGQDALSMWFAKLHAHFYKGEQFSQHKELENEVIHRLELAARNASSAGVILKMMLTNISAYYIASTKYTENVKSQPAALFYQFMVQFNSRFLLTLSTVIKKSLTEDVSSAESKDGSAAGPRRKTNEVAASLLPTFRLYCVWFCTYGQEIVASGGAFAAMAGSLLQTMAELFTLLCAETYNRDDLASSHYLLPEDIEMQGLEPLATDKVPEACRCFCDSKGNPKPALASTEKRLAGDGETMARILDILRCAYFLTEDSAIPLAHQVKDGWLVFEYRQCGASNESQQHASVTAIVAEDPSQTKSAAAIAQTISRTVAPSAEKSKPPTANHPSSGMNDPETTVFNMLTPFLKPPTPNQAGELAAPDETSYGMHTATANEVFGLMKTDPSPARSISSGKFQQLPWDWFNTPRPENSGLTASNSASAASMSNLSPGLSPNVNGGGLPRPEDPSYASANHPGRSVSIAMTRNLSATGHPTKEDSHRAQLLESFSTEHSRVSPFSEWANTCNLPGQGGQDSWNAQALGIFPNSSNPSEFSNLSSLYQGTPANGVRQLGNSAPRNTDWGQARKPSQLERMQNGASSQCKQFRMDDKRTTYDEAIFRSAYQGGK